MRKKVSGFTLIEMSIVLTIIGLVLAGVLVGRSLIRSSKVQTIVTDAANYQTAVAQFRQKYGAVPGDMPGTSTTGAQGNWGVNANCSTGGVGTGTQTCNGNGDGHITLDSSGPYEQFLVWQHLANAGFITGQYTGAAISAATAPTLYCSPGVNCPGGQVSQAQAYFLQYSTGALGSTANYWAQGPGHYLIVGAIGSTSSAEGYPAYPLLTAQEAYALDSKVDDGLPGQGMWKSFEATTTGETGGGYLPHCVVTSGTTTAPSDGTLASEPGSAYYVAYGNAFACSLAITLNF